jgi:hypothetical protein
MMLVESSSTWKTWATSRVGPRVVSVLRAANKSKRGLSEVSVSASSPVEISHPLPLYSSKTTPRYGIASSLRTFMTSSSESRPRLRRSMYGLKPWYESEEMDCGGAANGSPSGGW